MDPDANLRAERIVVVGAGAAGLAAARLLQQHGREVVVLEGRNRVGGRTSTVEVGGAQVDEGAAWIDGHKTNPLMALSERAGLETTRADYVDPFRVAAYDHARSDWLGRFEAFRHVVALAQAGAKLAKPEKIASSNLAERIDQVVDPHGRRNRSRRIRRLLLRSLTESNWADRADLLGAHAAQIGTAYAGQESVIVGGYGRLAEVLADGLDVRLEHAVESIRYGAEGVEVTASDETFRGSHAIVTVPLGVLKAGAISFDPPLPQAKVEAIERIGMGRLEKILFQFDEPFWRSNPSRARNLFSVQEGAPCPMFFDLSAGAGRPILAALVTGDHGTRLVEDPESVTGEALATLERLFPGRVLPPRATHTTNWQLDPFALGSYSTIRPETTERHFEDLVSPVASRLLFAGEATNADRPGYVDGAIDSGVREANRILGHTVDLAATIVQRPTPSSHTSPEGTS